MASTDKSTSEDTPTLIDTHCHLDFDRYDDDRDDVVARAQANGVRQVIIPAVNRDNCAPVVALAERYTAIFAAVGIHPNSTADWHSRDLGILRDLAQHAKVVAIGEIGIDYHWEKSPKATQHEAFAAQMSLAAELDLPVIIHNREASDDCIRLMSESDLVGRERAGVMHSFSADYAIARAALDLGFYLGFTGPVTYKKAHALRDVVSKVPLDRILIETDGPFLSPQSRRGKRNEPAYVTEVAERIAAVRQTSVATIAAATTANAQALFRLPS